MSKKPNNKSKKNTKKAAKKSSINNNKEQTTKNNITLANKTKVQGKTSPKKKRENIFKRVIAFFKSSINEIKKIVWPTPKATFKSMAVVLVIVAVIGLFVFALDTGLLAILGKFIGIANS